LSISVRGKVKYVVLTADDYEALRLAEIEIAYQQSILDIKEGRYVIESADQHLDRIWKKNKKAKK